MALDSVFANPPPCAVRGNKETFKHDDDGEKESSQTEFSDHSDVDKGDLLDEEGGEVEEGEIVDSEEENQEKFQPLKVQQMEIPNQQVANNANMDAFNQALKKKKKKKKRKKKPGLNENAETGGNKEKADPVNDSNKKIKKKKKGWYVDHDKVTDDPDMNWPFKPATSSDGALPNEFNGSREDFDGRTAARENNRAQNGPAGGKKRKGAGHGGPEKKKSKKSHFGGKGKRRNMTPRTICKFFLEGKCNKGNDCTFLHDGSPSRKQDLCKFYLNGFCAKGDKCLFMHKEFPCKFFHTGAKCYSQEQCKFSHDPLSDEMRRVLERYLDSNRDEDFHPQSPKRGKSATVINSPPHPSNDSNDPRKIPSLFDIQVGTPTSTTPMPSPPQGDSPSQMQVRPNFYSDTMKTRNDSNENKRSPSPVDEKSAAKDRRSSKDFELPPQDVDMRKMPETQNLTDTVRVSDDDDDKNRLQSSDSENEMKKLSSAPITIPSHLPKKQRELFLRIQQQQREAGNSQDESDKNDAKKDEEEEMEKDENWYTSDEDDDTEGDKPLTDVLKKLQQQVLNKPPLPSSNSNPAAAPPLDITKMLGLLYNKSAPSGMKPSAALGINSNRFPERNFHDRDMRVETRDPRKRRAQRPDPRENSSRFEQRNQWNDNNVPRNSKFDQRFEQRVPDLHHPPPPVNMDMFNTDSWSRDRDMRVDPMVSNMVNQELNNYNYVVPYKLLAMTISLPNYADILSATSSKNDPRVQNDPRLKKENHVEKKVVVEKSSENDSKSVTNDQKFPALAQNGLSTLLGSPPRDSSMPSLPPIVLPPVEPPNPYLLSPTEVRAKQPDLWSGRSDPRLGGGGNGGNGGGGRGLGGPPGGSIGRHSGLPSIRERTPYSATKSGGDVGEESAKSKVQQVQRRMSLDAIGSPEADGNVLNKWVKKKVTASDVSKSVKTEVVSVEKKDVGENGMLVIDNSSLKDVFKTIDPTASPFC